MADLEICLEASQNEGTTTVMGTWLKKPGDFVKAHEPIAEIVTDKVAFELVAPADGVLKEIKKLAGEEVVPGESVALLEPAGQPQSVLEPAAVAIELSPEPSSQSGNDAFSPAVRRYLAEHQLDPARIPATGKGGRLTIADLEKYREQQGTVTNPTGSRLVAHTPMRRAIAKHLSASLQAAPHVTAVFEADFSRVLADRSARKAAAASPGDVPTLTAYLIHAAVKAIQAVPEVNSRWHDDRLEIFEEINFGFGTATPDGGLIVPVIHQAQKLDISQLSTALRDLTETARLGKLARADVEGGTFTLSNYGVGGSLLAVPIVLNQGQAAILGAGKLQQRAVVNPATGAVEVKPMIYVTLTIDHRVIDGQQTNAFLTRLVQVLENEI
jgi:2-oxoglutarate dehydrogenase E2 component (dihydrolipoamide succinyltransferase)